MYDGIKDITGVIIMARTRQLGLRLDENDNMNLKRTNKGQVYKVQF
jgi:hypothetical protein